MSWYLELKKRLKELKHRPDRTQDVSPFNKRGENKRAAGSLLYFPIVSLNRVPEHISTQTKAPSRLLSWPLPSLHAGQWRRKLMGTVSSCMPSTCWLYKQLKWKNVTVLLPATSLNTFMRQEMLLKTQLKESNGRCRTKSDKLNRPQLCNISRFNWPAFSLSQWHLVLGYTISSQLCFRGPHSYEQPIKRISLQHKGSVATDRISFRL